MKDAIDLLADEQEEREQEHYAMLCETHRDKWGLSEQTTQGLAQNPSRKVAGHSGAVRDMQERIISDTGTLKEAA